MENKKIRMFGWKNALLIAALLLMVSFRAGAQADPAAQKLLQEVSKSYKGFNKVKADFSLKASNKGQQSAYQDKGQALLDMKGDRYKIDMPGQELISDGKNQWSVLKEEKEVQLSTVDHSATSISPANLFTFYNKGFKSILAEEEKMGNLRLKVVDLSPIDTKSPYFKIRLRINGTTKQIHDATIFDKSGSQFTYTITNLQVADIEDATFTYNKNKYPTFELVDLR